MLWMVALWERIACCTIIRFPFPESSLLKMLVSPIVIALGVVGVGVFVFVGVKLGVFVFVAVGPPGVCVAVREAVGVRLGVFVWVTVGEGVTVAVNTGDDVLVGKGAG